MKAAPDTGPDRPGRGLGPRAIHRPAGRTEGSGSGTCGAGSRRAPGPDTPAAPSRAAPTEPLPRPRKTAGTPSTESSRDHCTKPLAGRDEA